MSNQFHSKETLEAFAEKAFENQELYEYLVGEKGYAISNPYADTPTDPSQVFFSLKPYLNSNEDNMNQFLACLLRVSEEAEYSWMSLLYLLDLMPFLKAENLTIQQKKIVDGISENLMFNKNSLMGNKKWMGSNRENGLWAYSLKLSRILEEEYGIKIIK